MNPARETLSEPNPDLWTLTQAADFLDVSRKQLLDLIRQGDLRYVQRGLRIRIHRGELERYRESIAHWTRIWQPKAAPPTLNLPARCSAPADLVKCRRCPSMLNISLRITRRAAAP